MAEIQVDHPDGKSAGQSAVSPAGDAARRSPKDGDSSAGKTDAKSNAASADLTESRHKPTPNPANAPKSGYWWGTGRRKSAVARVRIRPGSGKLMINRKQLDDYFKREEDKKALLAPLRTVGAEKAFDVFINVRGGGITGQAGASLLGIARALRNYDDNYVPALRDSGHLTRDPRMVERKKPGQSGARRRFQFSKR